jgi:hypothetical protein
MEECRQRRRRWQRRRCRRVPCVVGEAAANRPGTSHTLEAKYVPRAIPLLTRLLGLSLLVALAALLALACLGLALACLDLRLLDRLFRLLPLGRLIPLCALLRTLLRGFVSLGAAR